MITCKNCGRVNDESTRICRHCGSVLELSRTRTEVKDYAPPSNDWAGTGPVHQSVEPYKPPPLSGGYRCPNCGTTYTPVAEQRISSGGWLVFIMLLFVCLPLFWIGLLMKEEIRVCPMCRYRLA